MNINTALYTLSIYIEKINNGFSDLIIPFLSMAAVICGILVIISKNPIVSVLFLIGLFLNIGFYLLSLGINFIGLSYLLVYVGAVSILFLFILMLINIRISELLNETSNSIPLAVITGVLFNYIVFKILPSNDLSNTPYKLSYVFDNNNDIVYVTSNSWDSYLADMGHITSLGNIMYTNLSIWLILTSLILLLAMVGAIVITISPTQNNYNHSTPLESSFLSKRWLEIITKAFYNTFTKKTFFFY